MATNNNRDSSHASSHATTSSSDNDSDRPRTPLLTSTAAPRTHANTTRSTTAPSKIPKLRTASVSQVQVQVQPQAPVSPPRTPADRDIKPAAALDWGSGGEWSAIVGETKRSTSESEAEAVYDGDDDGDAVVEVSEDVGDSLLQSTAASSGLFDDFEDATVNNKGSFDSVLPKEVSDDDFEPLILFEDGDQQKYAGDGEEDDLPRRVVLETTVPDSAASQTSDSEDFDLRTKRVLKEWSSAAESSDEVSDDEVFPVVSVLPESEQHIIVQDDPHDTAEQETDVSDAGASQTSPSDSDIHVAPALGEQSRAAESFSEASGDEEPAIVSAPKESDQHVVAQHDPHDTAEQETDLSHAGISEDSGSDSGIPTTSDSKAQSGSAESLEEVSDDEQHSVVSAPKDVAQHLSQIQDLHETAVQDAEFSDTDVSHTSSSDSDVHTVPAPKQCHGSEHLKTFRHDEQHPTTSASKDVGQHIGFTETVLLDGDVFDASDSDVSDMQLPPVTIREPFLNPGGREPTTGNRATVSPEIVLRGLTRDAHPEMIHFTLPHSLFSPEDLRKGLQYAYSTLQVATSKLAILEMLDDETTNMTGTDLRRWIALVDNSGPHTRPEPPISVIFESLSIGEMKAALEELVQSRLVVEGEAEKTLMLLLTKVEAKERQEKSVVIPAKRAATFDEKDDSSTKKRRVSEEDNETALDAFLTAIMVVLIGGLYLCLREYPVGSVVHRWINM